mmetsp:Transcript_402/g.935  ORF Transcript_402/g.935 Transcript_402/m.935 type:complete len:293 (+) Transcript_402:499-1377(+)
MRACQTRWARRSTLMGSCAGKLVLLLQEPKRGSSVRKAEKVVLRKTCAKIYATALRSCLHMRMKMETVIIMMTMHMDTILTMTKMRLRLPRRTKHSGSRISTRKFAMLKTPVLSETTTRMMIKMIAFCQILATFKKTNSRIKKITVFSTFIHDDNNSNSKFTCLERTPRQQKMKVAKVRTTNMGITKKKKKIIIIMMMMMEKKMGKTSWTKRPLSPSPQVRFPHVPLSQNEMSSAIDWPLCSKPNGNTKSKTTILSPFRWMACGRCGDRGSSNGCSSSSTNTTSASAPWRRQ